MNSTPSQNLAQLPPRYVAYYRVSTRQQGASGLGLEAQRLAVADFLKLYGGEVIAEFQEVESGRKSERPAFQQAADYAELAQASLLVAKLDRLSRDLHFITGLQKRGIQFKLADLPEIDQLTLHILAAMAQHEARMISQRTRQALQVAKAQGRALGNPWLALQRNFDVDAANQARLARQRQWKKRILNFIQHLQQQGITQHNHLAQVLNQRQLTNLSGRPFSAAQVSRLLKLERGD